MNCTPTLHMHRWVDRLLHIGNIFCFVLLLASYSSGWATTLDVPALTARVIDQTHTLSSQQTNSITQKISTIEFNTGAQIAVLIVASTVPEDIAAFSNRVAATWKLGSKDIGDGLLLVIAKNDRSIRIEVARALESAITDIEAAKIVNQRMIPYFRHDDYAQGVSSALDAIAAQIEGLPLPAPWLIPHHSKSFLIQISIGSLAAAAIFFLLFNYVKHFAFSFVTLLLGIFSIAIFTFTALFLVITLHAWGPFVLALSLILLLLFNAKQIFSAKANTRSAHGHKKSHSSRNGSRQRDQSHSSSNGSGGGGSFGGGGASGRW